MSSERDNPIYFSNQTYFLSAERSPDVVLDWKPDVFQNHTFFSANINPYWIWFGNIYGAFPLTWHWFTLRFLREPLLALFNLNKPFMTYRNIWFIFQRFKFSCYLVCIFQGKNGDYSHKINFWTWDSVFE